MGCAIGKFQFCRFGDGFTKRNTSTAQGSTTITAQNVHTYLSPDNTNPKCVFVFGKFLTQKTAFQNIQTFKKIFTKKMFLTFMKKKHFFVKKFLK